MPGKGKPFQKGNSGKPKGSENKTTRDIKEAYKQLIENNLENLSNWLAKIAINNPEKAIYILADLSEYVIPKLARQEHTGKDGEAIETITTINYSKLSDAALREIAGAIEPEGSAD